MPSHYQGTPTEVRALNTFIKLSRAANSLMTRVFAMDTIEDLTPSQFAVMEAIYHLGPLSQTDISNKVLRSGGNITLVIDNLEKAGLAQRTRSKEDRRVVTVSLTETGHEKIARIFPVHASVIVNEMNRLSADEQELLGELCRKLGKVAEE